MFILWFYPFFNDSSQKIIRKCAFIGKIFLKNFEICKSIFTKYGKFPALFPEMVLLKIAGNFQKDWVRVERLHFIQMLHWIQNSENDEIKTKMKWSTGMKWALIVRSLEVIRSRAHKESTKAIIWVKIFQPTQTCLKF